MVTLPTTINQTLQTPPPWQSPNHPHLKFNVDIAFKIHESLGISYVLHKHTSKFIATGICSRASITKEGENKGPLKGASLGPFLGGREREF